MSFYDNRYYYLNKKLLSIIGQWPHQSRLEGNLMFACTVFCIGSASALVLWGLIVGRTNITIIMDNGARLLMTTVMCMKLINCLCHKYKIKELLDHIEETWKMVQTGPENEILRNYAEQSKTYTKQYAIAFYSMWILYTTMPFVIGGVYSLLPTNGTYSVKFIYRLEHVIDVDKYFNLLMFHTFISVFYIVSVAIAVDCLFILCTQHVCALFAGIRYNMGRIRGSDFPVLKPNIADDEAYHIIIDCIRSYKRALKYSDLLTSTYGTSFFFILGNVIICLSFSTAALIMLDNQLDQIISLVAANGAQLLHIFYLSLTSQRMIDHSSRLCEVIYSCNWYKISLRSRQLLTLTLLRAAKPCQIKAGKIYVMSMENFSAILRVSMSYFTMLTSIQNNDHVE